MCIVYALGSFTYEKYFSGKYLGELVRLIFTGVLKQLGKPIPKPLLAKDGITTKDVSDILSGSSEVKVYDMLDSSDINSILHHICLIVSERAAVLVGLVVASLLNRVERDFTVIAVTGSLYKLHPTLASRLEYHTARLTKHKFSYKLCDDGSGKGAGLVAAIANRLEKKK